MAARSRNQDSIGSAIGPASMLRSIAPHDTNELEYVTTGIMAGGAGNISVVAAGDTDPVVVPIAAGQLLPIRARIIRATGTTATGIVALIS